MRGGTPAPRTLSAPPRGLGWWGKPTLRPGRCASPLYPLDLSMVISFAFSYGRGRGPQEGESDGLKGLRSTSGTSANQCSGLGLRCSTWHRLISNMPTEARPSTPSDPGDFAFHELASQTRKHNGGEIHGTTMDGVDDLLAAGGFLANGNGRRFLYNAVEPASVSEGRPGGKKEESPRSGA